MSERPPRNKNLNAISWHWYVHGVTPMQGNEQLRRSDFETVLVIDYDDPPRDYDPTRGLIARNVHRRNASVGNSWRVAMRAKARRAA